MPALKPCLTCGKPSFNSRCPDHGRELQRARNAARPWYRGGWRKLARAAIAADPRCVDCGTLGSEDNPLTADHVRPRSLELGVVVRCRSCNSKKGGRPS